MLVLTRRIDEEIVIDGEIRITVLDIRGERVRLGITAPRSVRVMRQEVYAREHGIDAEAAVGSVVHAEAP
jgi:carbon storage regulator